MGQLINQYGSESRLHFEALSDALWGCQDLSAMVILRDSLGGEVIVTPDEVPSLIAFLFKYHPHAGPTEPLPNDTIPQD